MLSWRSDLIINNNNNNNNNTGIFSTSSTMSALRRENPELTYTFYADDISK